jgi:uroporphyrinogen-III decarboxylase
MGKGIKTHSKLNYSFFQDGIRRMKIAMKGIPERVPICAQMHEFVMKELGANAREFYTTPELLPIGTLEIMEKYGIDVPFLDYDVYNIEAEGIGQRIVYSDDHMPDIDRSQPLIRGKDDLKKIVTPHFDSAGRFSNVIEMNYLFNKLLGDTPSASYCAPFSLAANIRGTEQLLMDIYNEPGFARELLDRVTEEVLAPWLFYIKEKIPNTTGICGNDASGSIPIVSPEVLKEWVLPYILRLRTLCGLEVYVPNWVGERYLKQPEELLDLKLKVCPNYLEAQDPDVAELGPGIFKEFAEKRDVPLILGIGASFLALSTPEEVTERVKQYVEFAGKNGRFGIYLCNLGATTPPENVKAAVAAVHKYGTYFE